VGPIHLIESGVNRRGSSGMARISHFHLRGRSLWPIAKRRSSKFLNRTNPIDKAQWVLTGPKSLRSWESPWAGKNLKFTLLSAIWELRTCSANSGREMTKKGVAFRFFPTHGISHGRRLFGPRVCHELCCFQFLKQSRRSRTKRRS